MAHRDDMNQETKQLILSEATPVRIGLVMTFIATLVSVVWWASAINSKLESILVNQNTFNTTVGSMQSSINQIVKDVADQRMASALKDDAMAKDISTLQARLQKINDEGSPITDKRLTILERESALRNNSGP